MNPVATAAIPDEVWREIGDLSWEGSESTLMESLLELWRDHYRCEGAALYLRRDGHYRLEASSRRGSCSRFPAGLESPTAAGPGDSPADAAPTEDGGPKLLEVPGGLIAWLGADGVTEAAPSDPLTLLLVSVLRSFELRKRLKLQSFQVNYRGVELEALYDVGLAIASTLDLEALSEEVLLRAVSLLDARRGALYLREGSRYRLDRTFGGDALASFEPETEEDGRRKMRVPDDLLPGTEHLLALPVEFHGDPRGVLAVGDRESRHGVGPFSDRDRRTLMLFANQAAIALENARLHRQELEKQRLEREMELAAEIQRQILPQGSPHVEGYDLMGWSRPARQVGGDYFDFFELDGGRLRVTVGDVTGKGIPAALLVSTLHSSLRLLLGSDPVDGELLSRLNRHIHESSAANKFITLLVAELDPSAHRLRYVNAGHNPGLCVRADGTVAQLDPGGLPVGMLPQAGYTTGEMALGSGDLVCLYSDGITEAATPEGEEFGMRRLRELLVREREHPLPEIRSRLEAVLEDFVQDEPQADDETLVLLRRCDT